VRALTKSHPRLQAEGDIKKQTDMDIQKSRAPPHSGKSQTTDPHNEKGINNLKFKVMKTTVIESEKNNSEIKNNNNPVTAENKNPQFVAGNPVNKDSVKPQPEPKADVPKAEGKTEAPKAEVKPEVKAEPVKEDPKKIVLNLEGTLKFIEELHRKAKQRTKLQETIKNLDEFEVELRDEADTTDTNYYNGCVLTIEDDNRRKFETKNPTIIWTVAQLVNNMCVDKLAEIEAGIVLPQ